MEEGSWWKTGGSPHLEFKFKFRMSGSEILSSRGSLLLFPYLKGMSAGNQAYSTGLFCSAQAIVSTNCDKSSRIEQRNLHLNMPSQWEDRWKMIPLVLLNALLIIWRPSMQSY